MTIKLNATELQILSSLHTAQRAANTDEAHAPQWATWGAIGHAIKTALATAYWSRNARPDGNRGRADAYAEHFYQAMIESGEGPEYIAAYERRAFVDLVRNLLTDQDLPLRGDEWSDHHELRDDGSLLVTLFGSATQLQATNILLDNAYPELQIRQLDYDRIVVRPAYGFQPLFDVLVPVKR